MCFVRAVCTWMSVRSHIIYLNFSGSCDGKVKAWSIDKYVWVAVLSPQRTSRFNIKTANKLIYFKKEGNAQVHFKAIQEVWTEFSCGAIRTLSRLQSLLLRLLIRLWRYAPCCFTSLICSGKVWDVNYAGCYQTLQGHTDEVVACQKFLNGVASASFDGNILNIAALLLPQLKL